MKLKLWSKRTLDEIERRLEILRRLTGEADDEVGRHVMSGRTSRRRRIFCLYSSRMLRFISASTRSEPLCTGRCRWFASWARRGTPR